MTAKPTSNELLITALCDIYFIHKQSFGSTVLLPLKHGISTLIDAEDEERITNYGNWFAHQSRYVFYVENKQNRVVTKLHRFLMLPDEGLVVDHKNRNGLDNRKTNLRSVSTTVNSQNKRRRIDNDSGVPGVYFSEGRGRKHWHAQITRFGEQRLIGRFLTKEEAIQARLEAEKC